MKVTKITLKSDDAACVPAALDAADIPFEPIACVDWPRDYPYCPEAAFRIAHTESALLIHYRVKEQSVRARYDYDNGQQWTDSCVEFFSQPAGDDIYYNIECNCIGNILMAAGPTREGREKAPQEALHLIRRWASLGNKGIFEEQRQETAWQVALIVPYAAFFKHQLTTLDGHSVRANFYKCGDELMEPHFLSWQPIRLPKPDFHRPDFFGVLEMEPSAE